MIVLEAKILDTDSFPALRQMNEFLSREKHKLFVDLGIKKKSLKDLKAAAKERGLSTRHFTSLATEVQAAINSRLAKMQVDLEDKKEALAATKKAIGKCETKVKKLAASISSIETYKHKVHKYKSGKISRKPKLKKSLQREDLAKLKADKAALKRKIHHKKRRKDKLSGKIEALAAKLAKGAVSLAFGGAAQLRKRGRLEANGYASHEDWLDDYRLNREGQSYWLGTHSEPQRNQNAQYDYKAGTLSLRVPYALEASLGERIVLGDIFFATKRERKDEHRVSPVLIKAFEEKQLKIVKGKQKLQYVPFSYRIIERSKDEFYVQVSFEPHPSEIVTSLADGAIGLDLNADHIAMVETDRFGNPAQSISLNLLKDGSSAQQKAVLCDHLADICAYAAARRKSIVIEKLDFRKKRASLREQGGKKYANMLSRFNYKQFFKCLASRAARDGVAVKFVNPAFSSVVGAFKYSGHHGLSSHEAAALVIARRQLRYSERPKTHGTREETASILKEHDFTSFCEKRRPRHVWSYYANLKKTASGGIRSLQKRVGREKAFSPQRPSSASVQLSRCRERPILIPLLAESSGTIALN